MRKIKNRISQRLESFDSSTFRDVIEKKQTLTDPVDLSIGEPEGYTPDSIKRAGIKAIESDYTRYSPSNGTVKLREAIRKKLISENNLNTPIQCINVVPGLTTGLLLVYMSILDPGDEIIIVDPSYPPYIQLANSLDAKVISVPTLPDFQLDIPAIKASVTEKTKAIVINSPNNPTGAVYPEKDLRKIASIAKKHSVFVISDEIYEHFIYQGSRFSIGSIYPDTISLFGFSKQYAMTGWRLGYITGPSDVMAAINELQQYAVFSSSTIAQHAAIEALKTKNIPLQQYEEKRSQIFSTFSKLDIAVAGAQGAYYVYFKTPNGLTDVEFTDKLLEHNLIMIPGHAFSERHNFVRLSYGARLAEVQKGMKILSKVINMVK